MQLDVFKTDTEYIQEHRLIQEIQKMRWSPSKRSIFEQCPRKYYYNYYGSKSRYAKNDILKERLKFLTDIKTVSLLAGDIIHKVIAAHLKAAQRGEGWKYNRLISFAEVLIENTIKNTNAKKNGEDLEILHKTDVLFELYYGLETEETIIENLEYRIFTCLSNFWHLDNLKPYKDQVTNVNTLIETRLHWDLSDKVTIDERLDYGVWLDENFIIIDWKTGQVAYEDTSLQMLAYAMWAIEKKKIPIKKIKIIKYYLLVEEFRELEFSAIHLSRAKAKIIQDTQRMAILHDFGMNGVSAAFDPHVSENYSEENRCKQCQFLEICNQ